MKLATIPDGGRPLPWHLLPLAAGVLVLLGPFVGLDSYWTLQVMLIAVMSMVVSSLNLCFGFAGELALGQVAVYAAGAYVAGSLGSHGYADVLLQLVAGGAAAFVVGIAVGVPGLRLGGWAMAMSSFFLVLIIPDVITLLGNGVGGFSGLSGIPMWTLFGQTLSTNATYVVILAVALIWFIVFRNMVVSRFGNALLVMRHSPVLATSLGMSVYRTKLLVYAVGSIPAGLAGVLFTQVEGFISPATFSFSLAIAILAASVLGGQRSVYGAIFGASLLQLAPLQFTSFSTYQTIVYGVFLVLCGVLLSQGISGFLKPYIHRYVPGTRPDIVPARAARDEAEPAQAPRGAVLEITDATVAFGGVTALNGVSLTAEAGRVTALIGPNGSGKTTLLNVVSGFYRLKSGQVRLEGQELQGLRADKIARLGVARTFQTPLMPAHLTTREVIASGRYPQARPSMLSAIVRTPGYWRTRRRDGQRTAELLELLDLTAVAGHEAVSLPLGTRRLVEVGRALAASARVLLLDEVASGLDEPELNHLVDVLTAIRRDGVTVVLVEHNFDLVLRMADVIYVLAQGELIATGTPEEIQHNIEVERVYLGQPASEAGNRGFRDFSAGLAGAADEEPLPLTHTPTSRPDAGP
jgi:branched-chain amino acid transport system permease protein